MDDIYNLARECYEDVKGDDLHILSMGRKLTLWSKLGPAEHTEDGYALRTEGYSKRCDLARRTVEHVLPIWDGFLPSNSLPRDMLDTMTRFWEHRLSPAQAASIYEEGWLQADNAAASAYDVAGLPDAATLVGYAACRALAVAIYDELTPGMPADALDDPYLYDPAEYAAAAMSGGFPRDPEADPERRMRFWEFYIFGIFLPIARE